MDADAHASNFVRVKFREPPIQPQLEVVRENVTISQPKKIKPPEVDPYADMAPVRIVPPVFFPGHTQMTRKEKTIFSDEAKYREEVRPNMYERMEMEKRHHKVRAEREKALRKRDAMKKKLEEDLQRMRDEVKAANEAAEAAEKEEKARRLREAKERKERGMFWFLKKKEKKAWGEVPTGSAKLKKEAEEAEKDKEEGEDQNQQGTKSLSEKMENGEESSDDSDDEGGSALNEMEKAQFRDAALQLKEQKMVRIRNSKTAYNTIPNGKVNWFATKMAYGIGYREPKVTQVLPWLYIGTAEYAAHQQYLMKLGITHIMNVTSEVGNHYPAHFVYQRIPMKDEENVDAISRFPAAVKFIKRVWDCRGKVYVHCTMGIARAPAVVLAYLIQEKNITLKDSFDFLMSVRPKCNMNNKFRLDLAKWEALLGEGSSVLHHREWKFFEFNTLKADAMYCEYREPIGVYNTARFLWMDLKRPEDLLFEM